MKKIFFIFSCFVSLVLCWSCTYQKEEEIYVIIKINDFLTTIDENPIDGQVLGNINASVNRQSLTYELINQNPPAAMSIDTNSGELSVLNSQLFDFEPNPTITAQVVVLSEGISKIGTVNIDLIDVQEGIIWEGIEMSFEKSDGSDPTLSSNQDKITDNVILTRGNGGGQIYNFATESEDDKNTSPAGTAWAIGTTADIETLDFLPFRSAVDKPREVVGKNLVLHLIEDNIYLDLKFTSWSSGKKGGFSYTRSTE